MGGIIYTGSDHILSLPVPVHIGGASYIFELRWPITLVPMHYLLIGWGDKFVQANG